MSWLSRVVRPKIQAVLRKRDTGESLWHKCSECSEMIFHRDFAANLNVCPACDHHSRLAPDARLKSLFDNEEYEQFEVPAVTPDPLKFKDQKKYPDRLKDARTKTGRNEAVTVALGQLEGLATVIAVQDFEFLGGSMGMAVGEAFILAAEKALEYHTPMVIFTASGGARMQEGMLSLMQMPRTTVAIQMLREAGVPYIVVLTDPTTGGVTASYGMLGDIQIAEPNALIGFAGQRVIEQTIREQLPEGFQRAEMVMSQGMVDMVVHRRDMRTTLSRILHMLMHADPPPQQEEEIALPPPQDNQETAPEPV